MTGIIKFLLSSTNTTQHDPQYTIARLFEVDLGLVPAGILTDTMDCIKYTCQPADDAVSYRAAIRVFCLWPPCYFSRVAKVRRWQAPPLWWVFSWWAYDLACRRNVTLHKIRYSQQVALALSGTFSYHLQNKSSFLQNRATARHEACTQHSTLV